jgi:uncharacterized protein (TIGR03083 family)
MNEPIAVLRTTVERLRGIVERLSPEQLTARAYPSEWTIADVLSHLGSGAVIFVRRLDDAVHDRATPDEFPPSVWAEWDAKPPPQQAADALRADRAMLARLDEVLTTDTSNLRVAMGLLSLDLATHIAFRVNEHALHTWDIEVALDERATIPDVETAFVVDHLELIARFTARPDGAARDVAVHTTEPARAFRITSTADAVTFASEAISDAAPDVTMPAEAFIRLVYGRLDRSHTPPLAEGAVVDSLRALYPGP